MKLGRNYKAVQRERFLWPTHQHLAALRPALTCSASSSSMFFRSPVCSTCAWRGWLSTRAALLRDEAAPLAVTKRPAAGRPHAPHRPHWGLAHLKQVGLLEGGADVLHDLAPHRAHQALVAKLVKHAAGIGLPPGGGEAISDQLPRTATLTPRCWPPLLGGHASMSPDDSVTNINVGTDVQMHVQYRWLYVYHRVLTTRDTVVGKDAGQAAAVRAGPRQHRTRAALRRWRPASSARGSGWRPPMRGRPRRRRLARRWCRPVCAWRPVRANAWPAAPTLWGRDAGPAAGCLLLGSAQRLAAVR